MPVDNDSTSQQTNKKIFMKLWKKKKRPTTKANDDNAREKKLTIKWNSVKVEEEEEKEEEGQVIANRWREGI